MGEGNSAPYVVLRVLGCGKYGEELDAPALKQHTLDLLKGVCKDEPEVLKNAYEKGQWFCTDGAPDERKCGTLLKEGEMPNLNFRCVDRPHNKQTILNHLHQNDDVLMEFEKRLVSGEKSLSRFLKNSSRAKAKFTRNQLDDCIAALQDLSYIEWMYE